MSIKRSREPSRRRAPEGDSSYAKKEERVYSYEADVASHPEAAFLAYKATYRFAKDDLLLHSVFGKGIVTRVEGTKIEVFFQAGPKKLVQNPAGSGAPPAVAQEQAPEQPPRAD